jgi:hypothetical protein
MSPGGSSDSSGNCITGSLQCGQSNPFGGGGGGGWCGGGACPQDSGEFPEAGGGGSLWSASLNCSYVADQIIGTFYYTPV